MDKVDHYRSLYNLTLLELNKVVDENKELRKKVETINAIIRECEVKNIQTVTVYLLKQAMKD